MSLIPNSTQISKLAEDLFKVNRISLLNDSEEYVLFDIKDLRTEIINSKRLIKFEEQSNDNTENELQIISRTKNLKSYKKPVRKHIQNNELKVWDKSKWFLNECNRENAELLLKASKNGSFLIRKSSLFVVKGYYAMSIKCNNSINHCLIQEYSNGFGFAKNRIFISLEDLVFDYRHREALNVQNSILNTFVLYPVKNSD
jgi:hypothetical protein